MSETPRGPEMQKLQARLFDNPNEKLLNFNVYWGPEAHLVTVEERAKAINDALDAIKRGEYELLDSED